MVSTTACPTCQMEGQARAMLTLGDRLVAKRKPHRAIDAYTTAINQYREHVCPTTIWWLRLHKSWCFKYMGMNVITKEDLLAIFGPFSTLMKEQRQRRRRWRITRKASRWVYLALSRGRACVCGELCKGPAKCGHHFHPPLKPSPAPFDELFRRARWSDSMFLNMKYESSLPV